VIRLTRLLAGCSHTPPAGHTFYAGAMDKRDCDGEGVTEDDVVVRLSRFLPPGKGYARARHGEYAVRWCPDQQIAGSARQFVVSSRIDFDAAFHMLIAASAKYCLAYRARRLRMMATP
jgi:hypothetical protein